MPTYTGPVDDTRALIQFFRNEAAKLRNLRKLVISREKTIVQDVNGDGIEFPGLTYGSATLEELLREVGVIFTPETLHNPNATRSGTKEFLLTNRWTWGHDRIH
jgi:hypothetical protein